jgi:hypothetical protein
MLTFVARFSGLLLVLLPLSLAACASSAPPADTTPAAQMDSSTAEAAPAPAGADAPSSAISSAEAAEQDFSRAGGDLDTMLASLSPSASPRPGTASKPPSPATQPAPAGAGATQQSTGGGAVSTCETVCRAYSSMQNAATRLCSLAGENDARCTAAQTRLGHAAERLKSACPVCEAAKN